MTNPKGVLEWMEWQEKRKPMTNEEWFASLTTEEKAKVLSNIAYSSAEMYTDILYVPKEAETKKWELWLKEVHKK